MLIILINKIASRMAVNQQRQTLHLLLHQLGHLHSDDSFSSKCTNISYTTNHFTAIFEQVRLHHVRNLLYIALINIVQVITRFTHTIALLTIYLVVHIHK